MYYRNESIVMRAYTDAPPSYLSSGHASGDDVIPVLPVSLWGSSHRDQQLCKECEEERRQQLEELSQWSHFTRRTTLHGLRAYSSVPQSPAMKGSCTLTVRKYVYYYNRYKTRSTADAAVERPHIGLFHC